MRRGFIYVAMCSFSWKLGSGCFCLASKWTLSAQVAFQSSFSSASYLSGQLASVTPPYFEDKW